MYYFNSPESTLQPFVKNHCDGVECLASHPKKLQCEQIQSNEFVQSLELSDVESALQSLQEGESNVNNFCFTLSNAFTKAAHCTFRTTCMVCSKIDHENKHRAMPVFKDWFDSDCRQKRWLYKRMKKRYKHTKSN